MGVAVLEKQVPDQEHAELITPEQFLEMADANLYELIDGKPVERKMGAESSLVAANLIRLAGGHVREHKLGKFFAPDCGYQIFADRPGRIRFPDGSFIARGRLPDDKTPKGHIGIPPDLSAEIVSPNDNAEDVEAKRVEFMKAGTRLLWVIYPETRTVHVFRKDGTTSILTDNDELSGEDVLPGFKCRVAELFEDV